MGHILLLSTNRKSYMVISAARSDLTLSDVEKTSLVSFIFLGPVS